MGLFEAKEKQPDRFTEKAVQNIGMIETRIVRDNETGVNYIFAVNNANGGVSVTPLLDDTGEVYVEFDDYADEEDGK